MQERRRCDPWVGKFPWTRAWQPPPVFLPGESHGQGSQGVKSRGISKSQTQLSTQTCKHLKAQVFPSSCPPSSVLPACLPVFLPSSLPHFLPQFPGNSLTSKNKMKTKQMSRTEASSRFCTVKSFGWSPL